MVLRYLTNPSHQLRTALLIAVILVGGALMLPRLSEAVPEGIPCTPEPTDMAVSYGDLVTCSIDPVGDVDLFHFPGSAGEAVSVQIASQSGGQPCVELFDPDGQPIGAQQCDWSGNLARMNATLSKTGPYSIRASEFESYHGNETMAYAMSLERTAPPSPSAELLRFGQGLDREINPIGDVDLYSFSAVAGAVVTVSVARVSGGQPCVELFDPDGQPIGAQQCDWSGNLARMNATLSKTGPYSIRASEFESYHGNETMAYRVDLQCVGQCSSSAFPTIATTLTGCTTCSPGNTFSAHASISNPTARWLEIKAGVYLPDRTPVNLLGDKHIELPPGFTFNGPVFSTTIPNGLPQGTYQFCGLLLERELGRSLAESCHTFTIGP